MPEFTRSATLSWRTSSGGSSPACFFAAVAAELGAYDGPVTQRIREFYVDWMQTFSDLIQEALDLGELDRETEIAQLAFELDGLLLGANLPAWWSRSRPHLPWLCPDADAISPARIWTHVQSFHVRIVREDDAKRP